MLRTERHRRIIVPLLICVLLGTAIGVWHNRQAAHGRSDFVTSTVRAITSPFVAAASGIGNWFGRQTGWLFRGRTLADENRSLRKELDRLRADNAQLAEANATVNRLRTQLGFPMQIPPKRLAADIVSRQLHLHADDFVIRRGSRDGLKKGMIVVAPSGLVGQVYDLGVTSSVVVMITDPASSVGAMVQRADSRAIGVCKGTGTETLSLQYLSRDADVRVGDVIVSSGFGGAKSLFSKGIRIGTVTDVKNDVSGATKEVTVLPSVRFDRLEEVYVLL